MKFGLVSKMMVATMCGMVLFAGVNQADAKYIRHADSVTSNVTDFNSVDNLNNQLGLTSTYVNGVTDFDVYEPTSVDHNYPWQNEWFAALGTSSGALEFDLGGEFTVDRIALWNEDSGGIFSVDVSASSDGINWGSSLGVFNPTNTQLDANYGADVFLLSSSTLTRYLRFDLVAIDPTDQGYAPTLAIGEVAFSVAEPVPEPATLVLFGAGLLGLMGLRRKQS